MICPICYEEVNLIRTRYENGEKIEGCVKCVGRVQRLHPHDMKVRLADGYISPAHLDDIKRRKKAPDGEIYRERGKKSFNVRWNK